jgi:hypothetical protein
MAAKKIIIAALLPKILSIILEHFGRFSLGMGGILLFFLFASWGLLEPCLLLKT